MSKGRMETQKCAQDKGWRFPGRESGDLKPGSATRADVMSGNSQLPWASVYRGDGQTAGHELVPQRYVLLSSHLDYLLECGRGSH